MPVLFISDLHLCSERPLSTQLFLEFLSHQGGQASGLYILGDLFESWVGDDVLQDPQAGQPYKRIVDALRQYSDAGTPVYLMHGNRDFLMAQAFCAATGASLLPDPTVITLDNTRVILCHGDLLCTDDVEYQQLRKQMHDPQWQQNFLQQSLETRLETARYYREQSIARTREKSEDIMDVNQATVEQTMWEHDAPVLIHGHTHRPGVHSFQLKSIPAQRFVLGAWYERGSVLICDGDACRLESFGPRRTPAIT